MKYEFRLIFIITLLFMLIISVHACNATSLSTIKDIITIIAAISTITSVIIALKYRQIAVKLDVKGIEHGSNFYRIVDNKVNNKVVGTLLQFHIKIRNKGHKKSFVEPEYEIDIPSIGYKKKLKPITDKDKFNYKTEEPLGRDIVSAITSTNNLGEDGKFVLEPDSVKEVFLEFKIENILQPEMDKLKCKLKIYDGKRSARCEIMLIKRGL